VVGLTLAHYRVTAAIGAGGMGDVYRATDSKLGREVALKVLPAEMARDPERLDRFRREARALAAINHPHIVTIHSVEEAAGVHFLTMELLDGQPLASVIPQSGLPVDRLVAIGGAIADALAAAHEKGIVHRDLKPGNVMVTADGWVKVLDFGLAKFADRGGVGTEAAATTMRQTHAGLVMGTAPYMSPEQIAGRPVDHRSDIFSLGVMLYEMAAGQRPFHGTSSTELAAAILRDAPPSICRVRADLPESLGRLIERCLEKDAAYRFASSRDLGERLRALTTGTAVAIATSHAGALVGTDLTAGPPEEGFWIAVLPFTFAGPRGDLTGSCEGLSEEIIRGLSRFSYLRVISAGSFLRRVTEPADAPAVAKQLGARYVMTGSMRQGGARIRVAVQLLDALSGAHLWAESYERSFTSDSLFELQDDLVPRIVSTVADAFGVLPYSMSEGLRNKATDVLSPYEAVLRSFAYGARQTPEEHAEARAGLERAVRTAPGYADAWAMLSIVYTGEYAGGHNPRPNPLGRALDAARRAVAIAPANHFAHQALAQTLFFRRELQPFRIAAQRVVALNPMDGCAKAFMGILTAFAGDWERGCTAAEQGMQLNPNHPGWYWLAAFYNAYRKRDYRAALDIALRINIPGFYLSHAALAAAYGQLGESAESKHAMGDVLALRPDFAQIARENLSRWLGPGDLLEHVLDGLRKAGLNIPPLDEGQGL
jgi:TolB-like protein/tRNA A-37 threonylcarbamoyl transferase component Bud32